MILMRFLVVGLGPMLLVVPLGLLLRLYVDPWLDVLTFPLVWSIGTPLATLLSARFLSDVNSLVVTPESISGPGGVWAHTVTFPRDDLDALASARRSAAVRLLGTQVLRSTSGPRIVVNRWWYEPDDLVRALESLGVSAPESRGRA